MRLTHSIAGGLAAAALLAPAAGARLPLEEQSAGTQPAAVVPSHTAPTAPDRVGQQPRQATQMARIEPPAATVTGSIDGDGFDWGAAAIGAGGAAAALLLAGAGASAVGHRRHQGVA